MRGIGRIFRRGSMWWIAYYHRGKEYRESSGLESEPQARKLLKKRLGEINGGRFIGPQEDRLTFDDLVGDLVNDFKINDKRSLSTALYRVSHLKQFFGLGHAIDITTDRIRSYQTHRLEEGASRATVNREVACLRRMLSLAVESEKLSRKPRFKMLDGEKVRQGFLEHGDFLVLLCNLPGHLKPPVEFLYFSGWRKGEALKLEWKDVDLEGRVVRLRIENSKNKESRVLPLTGRLWEIIQGRAKERRSDCPYVFHRDGREIKNFRNAWETALKKSGLERMLVHDLRRCAARNLSRAGVPESVAMEITGHKTRSMYRRYRIVDERDLREATERLQHHLEEQHKAPVMVPILIVPKQAVR